MTFVKKKVAKKKVVRKKVTDVDGDLGKTPKSRLRVGITKSGNLKTFTEPKAAPKKKAAAPRLKTPAKIAKIIDDTYAIDVKITAANKVVADLKKQRVKITDVLIETLAKEEIDGAFGKTATAVMEKKEHLIVKDRVKLNAFIVKNKALDFLQASIKESSIKEYMENTGKAVPGIGKFISKKLKVTKLKEK